MNHQNMARTPASRCQDLVRGDESAPTYTDAFEASLLQYGHVIELQFMIKHRRMRKDAFVFLRDHLLWDEAARAGPLRFRR